MYDNEIYSGAGAGSNTSGAMNTNSNGNNERDNGAYTGASSQSAGTYEENAWDNRYTTNQTDTTTASQMNSTPKKKKQGGGFFRKALLSVSLGLFFGLFAGIGFYAVQQTTGALEPNQQEASNHNVINDTVSNAGESESGIKLTDTSVVRVVSADVSDVVKEVMPAMVSIVNNYTESGNYFGQQFTQDRAASGSGIIVAESDSELLIVSNYHVVADASTLDVTFIDGTQAQAQIKGTDSSMDLAVIAIPLSALSEETRESIAISTLGDSDSLNLGEPVIAIGNALGYGQSVTNGIISALERTIGLEDNSTGTFIQTNAAINPGNSGGALLNVNGEVIGINSNKIGGEVVEGMGYAIPISQAKPIIAELMLKETRNKVADGEAGYIGITLQTVTDQFAQIYQVPVGIYVLSVEENSPAQAAGLLKGDIITEFDGDKLASYEDLQKVLQYYASGATAKLTVQRNQDGEYVTKTLSITLGTRPAQDNTQRPY